MSKEIPDDVWAEAEAVLTKRLAEWMSWQVAYIKRGDRTYIISTSDVAPSDGSVRLLHGEQQS